MRAKAYILECSTEGLAEEDLQTEYREGELRVEIVNDEDIDAPNFLKFTLDGGEDFVMSAFESKALVGVLTELLPGEWISKNG